MEELESEAKVQQMIGNTQHGKQGLGFRKSFRLSDSDKERRHQLCLIMQKDAEQKRLVILQKYEMQNSWLTWGLSDMMLKDLTWNKILTGYSEKLLRFVLNSNLQSLASPDNLRRWKVANDIPCGLCTKPNVGLSHILAGCPWVLTVENKLHREDRNTWRHNNVLLELSTFIKQKVQEVNTAPSRVNFKKVKFISAGKIPPKSSSTTKDSSDFGVLNDARDWVFDFDLPDLHSKDQVYRFPPEVDIVSTRCDGYILSLSKKICIIIELTVPMEENIEYWHVEKRKRYSNLSAENWTLHYFIFEVGCRGFIPSRFFPMLRQLGFSPRESRSLHSSLQFTARRCSYVIWVNRYNKDFRPFRFVTASPNLGSSTLQPLSSAQIARATKNRLTALAILQAKNFGASQASRAQKNRQMALAILAKKRKAALTWKMKPLPSSVTPSKPLPEPIPNVSVDSISNGRSFADLLDAKVSSQWNLLLKPGLPLVNSLNKCWFHSTLHLLTNVPDLRSCSLRLSNISGTFDTTFVHALLSIFNTHRPSLVHSFFQLVKDFNGRNNRYGQIAVPDFLDYLCTQSSVVSQAITIKFVTRLQCSKCRWISDKLVTDSSFKLYLHDNRVHFSLQDLINSNSNSVLEGRESVLCGNCNNVRTPHTSVLHWELCPNVLVIEIVRVTNQHGGWRKNAAGISFSLSNLSLPGFSKKYRVVATCHHSGSLMGGHWFTKELTEEGWYELNDLKKGNLLTDPPGHNDVSVVLLLLIAEVNLSSRQIDGNT